MTKTAPPSLGFERRISLALLLAVIVEAAGGLVWVGATNQRLAQLERAVADHDEVGERLARVEEQLIGARAQLARIEARLDER